MARSRTYRDDRRRNHRRAESRTSGDAAGAGKSARAYCLTDQDVAAIAARRQSIQPRLDALSATAVTGAPDEQPVPIDGTDGDTPGDAPVATLWATLGAAPENGITVRELADSTGMGRTWINLRLLEYAAAAKSFRSPVAGGSSTALEPNSR